MLHGINLKHLAEMESPERAVLSFYASSQEDFGLLEARVERIRILLEDSPDEIEHFEYGLDMLRSKLEELRVEESGVCVFACYALDFCQAFQLPSEVPFVLRVDTAPYIRPLARLQDEFEEFLVVACDNQKTDIFSVVADTVSLEETLKGDVKNHVKKGGMSQQRYSRRRDNELAHYCDEVVEHLEGLCAKESIQRIVLLGSEETIIGLKDAMPSGLADKVIGNETVDLKEGTDALIEEAYEIFEDTEAQEERDLWQTIRNAYKADDLAVLGFDDVWEALATGRADTVLINTGVAHTGGQCAACENVSTSEGERCDFCGKDEVFPIDLIDEMVKQAERTSAELEFADPPLPTVEKLGGVAALLRY